ncbi:hypothetical protein AN958_05450 [Leucoagaricus sp. SymC.cos]|nr:hypothetical protein AN958_05450 [Leucoagaricus sp. SymC.cos]
MSSESKRPVSDIPPSQRKWVAQRSINSPLLVILVAGFATLTFLASSFLAGSATGPLGRMLMHNPMYTIGPSVNTQEILSRCAAMKATPIVPQTFRSRKSSERYELGNNATLVRDATIFTGKDNGREIIRGDILLDRGVIRGVGRIPARTIDEAENLTVIEARGAWVTPGLVDLHSHLGVMSAPVLSGAYDMNSKKGPILPWLRSVDALNTHDDGYELAVAGGVTTAQILPGSNNAIGGQAFMVKLRKTSDRSPSSMIIEPPYGLNGTEPDPDHPRWRHMKQACGESVRSYGNRMDNVWALRSAYEQARKVKLIQDDYCLKAEHGLWHELTAPFPEDLQWEMLVDVLRGKVKTTNQCYEAVDLDAIVRLTNEFKFPLASFHHASEAYLIPEVLKRTYGGTPAVAILATMHRNKRESYRGSEFAARVLADHKIPVIMKTDHPLINSRYLLHEAQQAFYYGLPEYLALASVTSTPAIAAGLDHRIGILEKGADADVVMWDSHPLQLGATPTRVWIDGLLQIPVPRNKDKPVQVGIGKNGERWRRAPEVPNWDEERKRTVLWDGLPPLEGIKRKDQVVFTNVKKAWRRAPGGGVVDALEDDTSENGITVVVDGGEVSCLGESCVATSAEATKIDLKRGSISPGLMTFGSLLGTEEIASELSTGDGQQYDAMLQDVPAILNDVGAVAQTVDALMFRTRNALTAYRSGVTMATSVVARPFFLSVYGDNMIAGVSATFRTGASHAMERGAIVQDSTALHIIMGRPHPLYPDKRPSVNSQIATLRRLLYGWEAHERVTGEWFQKAAEGVIPLVIDVHSADIMASLLILKADVEYKIGSRMRMTFSGATEAHMLAKEISNAGVGVILAPIRPFPTVWDQRRILPGPPLTNDTALIQLLENGVIVGLGVREAWEARNTMIDLQWAALESNGRLSEKQAYALVTSDLERLLGVQDIDDDLADLVAYEGGGLFDSTSKVSAIISPARRIVDLL